MSAGDNDNLVVPESFVYISMSTYELFFCPSLAVVVLAVVVVVVALWSCPNISQLRSHSF